MLESELTPSPTLFQQAPARLGRRAWTSELPAGIGSIASDLGRRLGHSLKQSYAESVVPEVFAIICFLVSLWAAIAGGLYHEYHLAEIDAEQSTGNLARAFEESTRRSIGEINQLLLGVRAIYAAEGEKFSFDEWTRNQLLRDKMTAAIGMADSHGDVFADTLPIPSGANISDRPHFLAQVDPTHDALFISHPVTGRVSNQQTIQFTRKLIGSHGEFAGVAVFSLDCAELSRFYDTMDLNGGYVSLMYSDGIILAHGPLIPGVIGTRGSSGWQSVSKDILASRRNGVIRYRRDRTGEEKIAAIRYLPQYRLFVKVGITSKAAFRQVRSLTRRLVLGGLVTTLAISVIGIFWVLQKRRSVETQKALKITLETISQGIMMIDVDGHVPVFNSRALDLLGMTLGTTKTARDDAATRAIELAVQDVAIDRCDSPVAINTGLTRTHQDTRCEIRRNDGAVIEVLTHRLNNGGFVQTYTDVSEQRRANSQVHYLAHHDVLTGLVNRAHLQQCVPEILDSTNTNPHLTAVTIIDLDGFKNVNDTLGHNAGDDVLIEVARRLKALVREEDIIARLGGDEFVILQPRLIHQDGATALAERVLKRMADPIKLGSHQIRIGASLGIAYYPWDGKDSNMLFKHADIALYAAKNGGRGVFRCFNAEMVDAVNEHRRLESELRHALEEGELEVHFQPKYGGESLAIVGFEALTRWHHPTRGSIAPDTFIRIAEECGLIKQLGLWVAEQACAIAATWVWARKITVAVNVSLLQLRDKSFPEDIAAILSRTGLPAELLEIEVTETVLAEDNESVREALKSLKDMGIRIALDDFGTGYSSLSYLQRFPFDKIKIDRSFIHGQAYDERVRLILEAIIGMCRNLGLVIVAEGVETTQQLALLRELGCHELQGFLLGRPMPADAVNAALLRDRDGALSLRDAPGWERADEFETAM